jgi:hypothetical protein
MIVTAFAEGDRKTLKQLLSARRLRRLRGRHRPSARRAARPSSSGSSASTRRRSPAPPSRADRADHRPLPVEADLGDPRPDGTVIDGDPVHVGDVTDIWTFARETTSRDPNWKLIATESVD